MKKFLATILAGVLTAGIAYGAGLRPRFSGSTFSSAGAVTATGWSSDGTTTTTSQNASFTNAGGAVSFAGGIVMPGNKPIRWGTVAAGTFQYLFGGNTPGLGPYFPTSGDAATEASVIGVVNSSTTSVASATAGPNNLISYTLAAGSILNNTRGVRITAWGTAANNANAKTLTLNFGGTAILTTALTVAQADTWMIEAVVVRTGAATQVSSAKLVQGGTVTIIDVETGAPAETLTNAVVIKCTATNEITQLGQIVEFF